MGAKYEKIKANDKKNWVCDKCMTCGDPKCCKSASKRSFFRLGKTDKCKCSKCMDRH